MTDTYTIYLQNQSASTQTFWCFLAPPQELDNDPSVFANSSASLAVPPNYAGTNEFVIPVQYVVGAGAGNHAVGLNIEIISNVTNDASLTDTWNATYANAPPNEGPLMALAPTKQQPTDIAIVTNAFDQITNEQNGWYSNQSFGIETEAGFIGMTWSPDPSQTRTLTPKLTFYVSIGSYGSNQLANWDQVSNNAATINVPTNFNELNQCTVTYTQSGEFVVTAGPPASLAAAGDLAFFRSPAHDQLVALAALESGSVASDKLVSVNWAGSAQDAAADNIYLTGTVTVATALTAAFAYFVLGGTRFDISGSTNGATTFNFSYSGTKSVDAVKSLFVSGATLLFGGSG